MLGMGSAFRVGAERKLYLNLIEKVSLHRQSKPERIADIGFSDF